MPALPGGLWRHPDFLRLWAAQSVSLLGSGLGALPFAAIFFLDATGAEVALLAAATLAPGLVVGPFVGPLVDRVRRRPLLIASDLGRAAVLLSVLIAAALGELRIEHLYVVAFVNAAFDAVFEVAYHVYVPALVGEGRLVEANSKLAASAAATEAGAFSLGGWLVQLAGAMAAVVADAVSYVVSAVALLGIRTTEPAPLAAAGGGGVLDEVRAGAVAIVADRRLAALAAQRACSGLAMGLIGAVILVFGTRELGIAPGVLGLIFAVGGAMSFLGAIAAGPLTGRFGLAPTVVAASFVATSGTLCIAMAQGPVALAAAFLIASQLLTDGAATVREINALSLMQSVAPRTALGRVSAALRFTHFASSLAGALLAAAFAPAFGLRAVLFLGVAASLAGGVALWVGLTGQARRPVLEGHV